MTPDVFQLQPPPRARFVWRVADQYVRLPFRLAASFMFAIALQPSDFNPWPASWWGLLAALLPWFAAVLVMGWCLGGGAIRPARRLVEMQVVIRDNVPHEVTITDEHGRRTTLQLREAAAAGERRLH